ncbi:MAG: bacteriohemerythrin [Myxococcaceae bacterium]
MKELATWAQGVVSGAARLNGHTDQDWAILASVKETTRPWSSAVGNLFGVAVYAEPALADVLARSSRADRENSVATWFERLASGFPGTSFWPETALIGFAHAASGVSNDTVLAFMSRLEAALTANCFKAFSPQKASEVIGAFNRVLGLAQAVMVQAWEQAIITGVTQLGFNPKLMARMRSVAVRKMVDEGRNSLPVMVWDDSLSVGVAAIDAQHQRLVELLNQLHHSHTEGRGNEVVHSVLQALASYTVEHFAFEERLFAAHGFPQLAGHQQAHEKLVLRVTAFLEEWKAGRATMGAELFMFLRGWLNGHIRGSDREAGRYLRSQGVT